MGFGSVEEIFCFGDSVSCAIMKILVKKGQGLC